MKKKGGGGNIGDCKLKLYITGPPGIKREEDNAERGGELKKRDGGDRKEEIWDIGLNGNERRKTI